MNRLIWIFGMGVLAALIAFASSCSAAEMIAIEFTADWCPFCRKIKPTVTEIVKEGFQVRVINIDAAAGEIKGTKKSGKELAAVYGVTTIPAMFVQTFDDAGKAGGVARVPLANPEAIRAELLKAGLSPLPPVPPAPVE